MSSIKNTLLDTNLIIQVKEANNFDFIRFFLAYSVMFNHFSTLTDTNPFWIVSGGFRVKGFFIISGFLVMFSFLRSPDTYIFFRKRVQRIMPAYSLVILLCLILGFCLTVLPHREFLTSSQSYTYLFTNLLTLNFLCPDLPGVFEDNTMHAMNGSLWTIKVELMLYMTVPLIYWLLRKYNKLICLWLIYLLSFTYHTTCNHLADTTHEPIYEFLKRQFPGQMMYFCSGIILLIYFPLFRKYMKYLLPAGILLFACRDIPLLSIFEPIALASVILSVAYGFKWLHVFNRMGNFSYGIFLSHFPVIQTFIHFGLHEYSLPLTLTLTTVICTCFGMLSWKYIEKPCLYRPKFGNNRSNKTQYAKDFIQG